MLRRKVQKQLVYISIQCLSITERDTTVVDMAADMVEDTEEGIIADIADTGDDTIELLGSKSSFS